MDNIRVENIRDYMNTPQGGEGIWQANETVEVGDMRTLSGRDNTGYILEYVKSGVTGDTQPVVPVITEVANYSAVDRVGKMRMIFNLAEKDVDEILAAGVLYNRATYEELWNYVQLKPSLLISEAEWQAKYAQTNGKFVPYYSEGDGTTTFRTPLLSAYPCGVNNSNNVGEYASDGLPNIEGSFVAEGNVNNKTVTGCMSFEQVAGTTNYPSSSEQNNRLYTHSIDASRSNSIYGNADEVRPKTMYGIWVIKAVGVIVDSIGNTDIQNVLTGIEQLQEGINDLIPITQQDPSAYNYIKEPYGKLEVWGYIEQPANTVGVIVTLPQSYKDINTYLAYASIAVESSSTFTGGLSICKLNNNQIKINVTKIDGTVANYNIGVYFHTVGWWK